jgi:hypothetical protein
MILATAINGASLDQLLSFIGPSAVLKVYAGPVPANCETGPGVLLARLALPIIWLTPAGAKVGEWRAPGVAGTGNASYFRIYDATEARCGLQGLVGPELQLDSPCFVAGSDFAISRFRLTDASGGSIACRASGQSLFRRLIREMCRESGGTHGLVLYRTLIRDLRTSRDIPASDTAYLLAQDGSVLTTQGGVPFQVGGLT